MTALDIGVWGFLTVFLLLFGLFLVLSGLFTAYFGSGKSRKIGVGLFVFGLIVGVASVFLYDTETSSSITGSWGSPHSFWSAFLFPLVGIIGVAVLGALAAIGIFLVAIMKS